MKSLHRARPVATALFTLSILLAPITAGAQKAPPAAKAAAQPAPKATQVASVEGITEYRLPNGLRVLLFPDQSKPTVTVNITYLVGSRHEGYGETGMAHLLEHMLFKGSTNHRNIPQELTDHGARPNGSTWYDRTNYFETTPSGDANLAWALDLEADRMVNSFVAKKDLESEFSVVRNEFEMGENSPLRVTLERVMDAAYRWHGYGRSTIGNKADIENVPIDRLQAFYRKYYQPDNAVLVVAGKFDPQKALPVIEDRFGRIPKPVRAADRGNLIHATYTTEPVQDGERVVEVRRVGDEQIVWMGYHVPAGSHPDFAAIDVLNEVLTANPSGRLYQALIDTKLASQVDGVAFQLAEPGMLLAYAQLRQDQSVDKARAAMAAVLDTARKFTDEEVNRAKTTLLKNIELSLTNSENVGYDLTEWASRGDWRLLFIHRDRIEKVTAADVQRVAAAYLKPANRTVAYFVPTPQPDRAEVPAAPNIGPLVAVYKGKAVMQAGEAFDASPKNIDSRTKRSSLANGMQVTLLSKQTRGNRVVGSVVLRHGTMETLAGKGDVGVVTAALLPRGTTQLTRQQVKDSLDRLKAQVQIVGGGNVVQVSFQTVRDNLAPVLDLIAQQLRSPRFDSTEFETLKRERLAQLDAGKSEPQVLAITEITRRLQPYPKGHPLYTESVEEQIAGIGAVTLQQVRAFHHDFYGASYADLALVGDFDEAAASAAAARLFGDWKSPQPFSRAVRTYTAIDSQLVTIETPDKANAMFVVGQNVALRDDDPDFAAMRLASFMLGEGFLNSRIPTRLRQKEGISYGAGTVLQAQSLDRYAQLLGYAILNPVNIERTATAYREEIDRVLKEGFTKEEVEAARAGFVQGRGQGRANDQELVGTLVARRFAGRTMSYDDRLEQAVMALTAEQVNSAVKKYLDPSKTVIVRAGDFAKNPPAKVTP